MRILDGEHDTVTRDITLYLTENEAKELIDSLQFVLGDDSASNHWHVNDRAFNHEITVTIVRPGKLHQFNQRSLEVLEGFEFDE